jgi:PAT family beta-lactamase induction signal transducer AmpG
VGTLHRFLLAPSRHRNPCLRRPHKFADQLAQALTRPFPHRHGYNATDRGIALATVGLTATIAGGFIGGWATTVVGLGHALWMFGVLQIFSNLGYFLISRAAGPNLPLMFGAVGFELLTSGLSTGAFSVLLLRMTQKRFSATQYALFSSLFALPRLVAGPISGFVVDAIGWPVFFLSTMVVAIPGLVMLARFAPPGVREPVLAEDAADSVHRPLTQRAIMTRGLAGVVVCGVAGFAITALLAALKALNESAAGTFDFGAAARQVAFPSDIGGWVQLAGIITFALVGGLFVAAAAAARGAPRRDAVSSSAAR